jgi:hypothetical protein
MHRSNHAGLHAKLQIEQASRACPEVRYILRIATAGEIDAARSAGHP